VPDEKISAMPSRKRNKGQERKANMANRQERGRVISRLEGTANKCNHGFPACYQEEYQSCEGFLEIFVHSLLVDGLSLDVALSKAVMKFHVMWKERRELLRAFLLSSGTNGLLSHKDLFVATTSAVGIAILLLEDNNESGDEIVMKKEIFNKYKPVVQGCYRTLVRLFCKRIPCSCLDCKYSEAKMQPKIGICDYCNQQKERSSLMMCGGCKNVQYCSKECQREDWPQHAHDCCSEKERLIFMCPQPVMAQNGSETLVESMQNPSKAGESDGSISFRTIEASPISVTANNQLFNSMQ